MPQSGTTAEVIASECKCSYMQECVSTGCVPVESESAVLVMVGVAAVGGCEMVQGVVAMQVGKMHKDVPAALVAAQ